MMSFCGIDVPGPVMLAPIAGYTDSPYRRIARRFGAGLTVTELISADGIVRGGAKTREFLRFGEGERPIAIQLFGHDPAVMGEAAAIVTALRPDVIDINMGCPARKVCNSGSGAALILDPDLVHAITVSVVRNTSLPVSAKIRIGWDAGRITWPAVLPALEDAGVRFIAVHGRTRAQGYSGRADWDTITAIRAAARVPVIGNGDITSFDEARARMAESGCPAVMVGRGAIGNPWIFSGAVPSLDERLAVMLEHLDLMVAEHGSRGIILMRKHLVQYIHGLRGARRLRQELVRAVARDEVAAILEGFSRVAAAGDLDDSEAGLGAWRDPPESLY